MHLLPFTNSLLDSHYPRRSQSAEKRFEALKYVFDLGAVDAFTIGFSSTKQIDETLEMIQKATA